MTFTYPKVIHREDWFGDVPSGVDCAAVIVWHHVHGSANVACPIVSRRRFISCLWRGQKNKTKQTQKHKIKSILTKKEKAKSCVMVWSFESWVCSKLSLSAQSSLCKRGEGKALSKIRESDTIDSWIRRVSIVRGTQPMVSNGVGNRLSFDLKN